ncbi:MAG: class I SAM-dependent methyltransferase [Capnocytophaga sp.]|nr:class I SAM-dependent methyltransferase [Capnocytophaga sp.]
MSNLLGKAIQDYYTNHNPQDIQTETDISELDTLPIEYLFRYYEQMPKIEQKAMQLAYGKVLDVGCGAGAHSLYLQEKGLAVTAIDISEEAISVCQQRGVADARCINILQMEGKFDTILLLMNGIGIGGKLQFIDILLTKLKELLSANGQILLDSSDIIYMFDQNEDGSYDVPMLHDYYGEVEYTLHYKGKTEHTHWLYIDYNTLQNAAVANDLHIELLYEGENYDYLARLTHRK